MPYFLVDGKGIHDKLKEPKFHLLVMSHGEYKHQTLCAELERDFGQLVDCHFVPIDTRANEIFESEEDFIIFLRPDNHIALMSTEISLNAVREYLNRLAER